MKRNERNEKFSVKISTRMVSFSINSGMILQNRFISYQAYKAEKKRITSQGESEAAQLREENEKLRRELEDAKQQVKASDDLFWNIYRV